MSGVDVMAVLREASVVLDQDDRNHTSEKLLTTTDAVAELIEALKVSRRELQACQAVIHLHGGFDPAYVAGAKASIKQSDAALANVGPQS